MKPNVRVGQPDPDDVLQMLAQASGSSILEAARDAGIELDYSMVILSGPTSAGVAMHAADYPAEPRAAALHVLERLLFHTRRLAEAAGYEPVAFVVRDEHSELVNLYPEGPGSPDEWGRTG